jgi:hypothetical protein
MTVQKDYEMPVFGLEEQYGQTGESGHFFFGVNFNLQSKARLLYREGTGCAMDYAGKYTVDVFSTQGDPSISV